MSLLALPGTAQTGPERLVLEDFSPGRIGEFPPGWMWRRKDNDRAKRYIIREEDGRRYLNAKADGMAMTIFKKVSWNILEYPILTWRWRVKALPSGGDERVEEKNDSGAGVYVVFSRNWLGIPKSIKYVWSATLPVGTVVKRKGIGQPFTIVLQSGKAHLGEWMTERENLCEDFKRTWGREPGRRTAGIAILTDADETHSFAEADYANMVASSK